MIQKLVFFHEGPELVDMLWKYLTYPTRSGSQQNIFVASFFKIQTEENEAVLIFYAVT